MPLDVAWDKTSSDCGLDLLCEYSFVASAVYADGVVHDYCDVMDWKACCPVL